MRKLVWVLSLLAVAAVALTAAGRGRGEPSHGRRHVVQYCDNPTFPPMESTTTAGKPVGFDIDFANALATQLGGKATYVFSSFTGMLPALGSGRCDVVISGLFITPDRTKQFPATAYMHTHRALIVAAAIRSTSPSPPI